MDYNHEVNKDALSLDREDLITVSVGLERERAIDY